MFKKTDKKLKGILILLSSLILVIAIISLIVADTNNSVYAGQTGVRYFLQYNSFKQTFSKEITENIQEYRNTSHYEVHFDGKNVKRTIHHFFSDNDYIITKYWGTDIPYEEITYRNINKDLSMLEMVKSIERDYNLKSSFLYSKVKYEDGLEKLYEMYRNGKVVAYKQRYYKNSRGIKRPIKEEHWELSENKKARSTSYIVNSRGEKQKVFDGNGFELRNVWQYNRVGLFNRAEDYKAGKLEHYHIYFYYHNTATIRQIDDKDSDNKFNTRRFYTTFSTLMEVWYYDDENHSCLKEFYNSDGKILEIHILDKAGNIIESHDYLGKTQEFFLEKRREVRKNND